MNKPRETDVPALSVVLTLNVPRKSALTTAAAVIAPIIWVIAIRAPRTQSSAPTRHKPKVTAGLNSPPLTRKNTHALAASEKPKTRLMYSSWAGLEPWLTSAGA